MTDNLNRSSKVISILYITRSFPPAVGGMEKLSYEISENLSKVTNIKVIANKRGKMFLPVFFLVALVQGVLESRKVDIVLIGDPVLSKIGWLIKKFAKIPVIIQVHGLDICYQFSLYQRYLRLFFSSADLHICISRFVEQLVREKYPSAKTIVINPGTEMNVLYGNAISIEKSFSGKKTLLTVGRLVKRKGIAWFVENVMPILPNDINYVIAGDGPEKAKIREIVSRKNLESRVTLLDSIDDTQKKALYRAAQIFIMPNIREKNDPEGFGLVALEASLHGLPIVAANIEGIKDAVTDGENGFLVDSGNAEAFQKKIISLFVNEKERHELGIKGREFVKIKFSWKNTANKYLNAFNLVLSK